MQPTYEKNAAEAVERNIAYKRKKNLWLILIDGGIPVGQGAPFIATLSSEGESLTRTVAGLD